MKLWGVAATRKKCLIELEWFAKHQNQIPSEAQFSFPTTQYQQEGHLFFKNVSSQAIYGGGQGSLWANV